MQRHLIDGRYALGNLLGGGGMAQVYLAHDEVLGRDVALKILRQQYTDEEFVERFKREAKNAAALNHPNIVQVYDQGQTEDGTYYIAMEYVPGETLKSRINSEGRLDPGEAAGIASRIADALSVAHERGIVHRDIKPQNVLLTPAGEAKVVDFGIARAASAKTVTETNLVLGTAAYMSPEQVSGERVGPASDLYSLGVVLYEMLTGELPYQAEDPIATAMKHLDEPPRHLREANPAVPEALDALTMKLLAKKPEDRYPSAAELAEDLRRVRDGLSPLAAELEGQTRTAPTVLAPRRGPGAPASSRRRSTLLPLLALLLVAALLGGLAWALSRGSAEQVEVPRVEGLSRDEAQQRLEGAGLELGSQTEAQSEEVAEGVVIEQDPAQGTEVDRGTNVDLIVSAGPPPEPAVQTSSPSASPTASPTASPAASPTASPSASPRGGEEAAEEARKAAEEAQKKAEERREKAAEEREKRLEEAQKRAEERQEKREEKKEE